MDEENEANAYSAYGPTFLIKLLAGLIDGHVDDINDEKTSAYPQGLVTNPGPATLAKVKQQRLSDALKGVTGGKVSLRKGFTETEIRACEFMASELYNDKCARDAHRINSRLGKPVDGEEPSVRSVLQLSEEAAKKFYDVKTGHQIDHNISERLRDIFRGNYQRKLDNSDDVDHPANWKYRVVERDYVAETLEHQDLQEIQRILKKYGVPFEIN